MTKHIRILLMVAFAVAVLTGTAAAYDGDDASFTLRQVTISDSSEKDYTVKTLSSTVGELFEEINIEIDNDVKLSKGLNEKLSEVDTIKITRPTTVTIDVNSETKTVKTFKATVGEVLKENRGFTGSEYEIQSLSESARLYNNMTIKLIKPTDKIIKSTEKIPFETKRVDNADMEEGTEKVSQEGKEGILEITKRECYFNGKIEKIEEVSREVVQEPVDKIIQVGTKKKEVKEVKAEASSGSINGINYRSAVTMHSTAYTPYDEGCTGRTATGIKATKGVAAVDTSVIPFGTKLYIPGYGTAVAADTGGAIKGNRIDLCYDTLSEAYRWGRKNVTVYILE